MTQSAPNSSAPLQLTVDQQMVLLHMARDAITQHLAGGRTPQYQTDDPHLMQLAGAFVTLRHQIEGAMSLRGCIGRVEAERPLLRLVPEMAIKAATSDPRFLPVTADELPHVHIEISVLSPLVVVTNLAQIEVGKHGLLIEGHGRRGLLLPEVPLTHGWNRQAFLEGVAQKASLSSDAWPNAQVRLYLFTTLSFQETTG